MKNKQKEDVGYQALKKARPLLAWISPPHDRRTKTSSNKETNIPIEKLAKFTTAIATSQMDRQRYFAFTYPWNSDFWNTETMTGFLKDDRVKSVKVYVDTYDPNVKPKTVIALVHNLPDSNLEVLKFGPYRLHGEDRW